MRAFRRLAALTATTASAGLLLAAVAGATPAGASTAHGSVRLTGGTTTVTTSKGIAAALVGNGIIPLAVAPATQSLVTGKNPVARFSFPVSGGKVSLSPLGGDINHRGGIAFLNAANGKEVQVGRFTIRLKSKVLSGIVNGNPKARVRIFNLGLAHAKLAVHGNKVTASNISLTLTWGAAAALDKALGTHLFKAGLHLGTAATTIRH